MTKVRTPKKLIEVALPLDAINEACVREKSIHHGHPSTLHLWWARRPLAAARAVIFAQMVNDPGYQQGGGFRYGVNKEKARQERKRLFDIIKELVKWENTNNEEVLEKARAEIRKSWRETCELNKKHPQAAQLFNPDKLPDFHDPFAGGGTIPLEAQRLGLTSYASDLNPVAVVVNKAMIEIPPRFAGRPPVGPVPEGEKDNQTLPLKSPPESPKWKGAQGLAEDVRRYGTRLLETARKRIGHYYPAIEITKDMVRERPDLKPLLGEKLTVIAWLWAWTVKSSNPAFSHVDVPLVSSFVLSSRKGKEAYVEPVVDGDRYTFKVKVGTPPAVAKNGTNAGKRAAFRCILSGSPISYEYIRSEGKAKRLGQKLMAIVAEGKRGRIYLSPTEIHDQIAKSVSTKWVSNIPLPQKALGISVQNYGFTSWHELFTQRQLTALTTFSDLIAETIKKARLDAIAAGMPDDGKGLDEGGVGATAYGQAIGVYLTFGVTKLADMGSSICGWQTSRESIRNTFVRQAIPMTWDFAESNPTGNSTGSFFATLGRIFRVISESLVVKTNGYGLQSEAQIQGISKNKVVSTDPPYYDNIGYADLSDFFYVWLRRNLKPIYPGLFTTMATPKADELIASSYRHGGKKQAEQFFLKGMKQALENLASKAHPAFPVTIYYAFKQSETTADGTSNTGWETFLQAVIESGFAITGTWPIRTEGAGRMRAIGSNALASSIVLVCRRRADDAPSIGRRQFLRELNAVLPEALAEMIRGGTNNSLVAPVDQAGDDRENHKDDTDNSPVAPVDLSQAIIGPGMEIFSQYAAVLEADGKPMAVGTALRLINSFLTDEDFDSDTQFCLNWFEQHRWSTRKFGDADVLARAKGTTVDGLVYAGVADSAMGDFKLLHWQDLPKEWNPETDKRLPQWEALHHLIRILTEKGETAAGAVLACIPDLAGSVRSLAYRLYTLCEQKNWSEDARMYNTLVVSWEAMEQAATRSGTNRQQELDF